jgi:hypothetical protein
MRFRSWEEESALNAVVLVVIPQCYLRDIQFRLHQLFHNLSALKYGAFVDAVEHNCHIRASGRSWYVQYS